MKRDLTTIIQQEQATHVQQSGLDMITLYKTIDGVDSRLPLARIGAGLRGSAAFEERDEWFRIGSEKWTPVAVDIPVNHPLWPALPANIVLMYLSAFGFLPCRDDAADLHEVASMREWLDQTDVDGMTPNEMFHKWAGWAIAREREIKEQLRQLEGGQVAHIEGHEVARWAGGLDRYIVDGTPLSLGMAAYMVSSTKASRY